ncbi:MAG: four helix bundle protein, partial [Opitutaceae bacterium]
MAGNDHETWRNLIVWQKAHEAVLLVYHATKTFPIDERYRV